MKKGLFLAITLLIATAGFAQQRTVERLFHDAAAIEGAERTDLSEMDGSVDTGLPDVQIDKLEVIQLENVADELREQIKEAICGLNDPAYEILVSVSEPDNNVRILGKTEDEKLTELMVLVCNTETVLIRISGDLDKDAILSMSEPTH